MSNRPSTITPVFGLPSITYSPFQNFKFAAEVRPTAGTPNQFSVFGLLYVSWDTKPVLGLRTTIRQLGR